MKRLTEQTVRMIVADMAPGVPDDMTLVPMFQELVAIISDLSDVATQEQASRLLGIATVLSKYAADEELNGAKRVRIDRGTRQ